MCINVYKGVYVPLIPHTHLLYIWDEPNCFHVIVVKQLFWEQICFPRQVLSLKCVNCVLYNILNIVQKTLCTVCHHIVYGSSHYTVSQ